MKNLLIATANPRLKSCLVNLPEQWTIALNASRIQPSDVILRLTWEEVNSIYVSWSGNFVQDLPNLTVDEEDYPRLEIDQTFANAIKLSNNKQVIFYSIIIVL